MNTPNLPESCIAIADDVIADLSGTTGRGPREVQWYLEGNRDFVYVEEGVSAALDEAGIDQAYHAATCGIVFEWLERAHKIAPPAWYLEAVR